MKRRVALVGALFALGTALGASTSEADILFSQGASGTGNNVLFKCPAGDTSCQTELFDNDNTLIGTVQNTTRQVQFTSDVNIIAPASGQARIEEFTETTVWTMLDIDFLNFDSTNEVVLRIKPSGTAGSTATIVLFACNQFFNGSGDPTCETSTPFTITAPAGDFFTLSVAAGQLITSVRVTATSGSLSQVEQVRIGRLFDGDNVVLPEPASLLLMGAGFLVTGYKVRRRMRSKAA